MQKEENYNNVLHDIGYNPFFFLFYYCSEQINIYRQYCRSLKYPKLILDATGSIVKPFRKLNSEKTILFFCTKNLFMTNKKKNSFTATNMLSERHTNVAISN